MLEGVPPSSDGQAGQKPQAEPQAKPPAGSQAKPSAEPPANPLAQPESPPEPFVLLAATKKVTPFVPARAAPSLWEQFSGLWVSKPQDSKKPEIASKVSVSIEQSEVRSLERNEEYFHAIIAASLAQRKPSSDEIREACWNVKEIELVPHWKDKGKKVALQFNKQRKEFERNFQASQDRVKKSEDPQAIEDAEALLRLARVKAAAAKPKS